MIHVFFSIVEIARAIAENVWQVCGKDTWVQTQEMSWTSANQSIECSHITVYATGHICYEWVWSE